MVAKVVTVHPYFEKFLRVYCSSVGVCQFPNFKECPIKGGLLNPETGKRWDKSMLRPNTLEEQQELWKNMNFESTPKWKGMS